jgi:hypothetical protein
MPMMPYRTVICIYNLDSLCSLWGTVLAKAEENFDYIKKLSILSSVVFKISITVDCKSAANRINIRVCSVWHTKAYVKYPHL